MTIFRPQVRRSKVARKKIRKQQNELLPMSFIEATVRSMFNSLVQSKFAQEWEEIMAAARKQIEQVRKGDRGPRGVQGLKGERGPKGEKGDRGPQGIPGSSVDTQEVIEIVLQKIPKPKNGKDGRDADEARIEKRVLKKIEIPTNDEIVQAIIDKRLPISAIKGLAEELSNVRSKAMLGGGSSGGGGGANIINITSGTIDDSNTVFEFEKEVKLVVVNGATYRDGAGVTISGSSATLDNPVGTGGSIFGLD